MPLFPAVPFPPNTKGEDVLKSKPILFLAILNTTNYSNDLDPSTQAKINAALNSAIANAMWKCGEKTLELVQALQLASMWHNLLGGIDQITSHHMSFMATLLSMDLGIGKQQTPLRSRVLGDGLVFQKSEFDPDSIESRRAWVICYFSSVSIFITLRRPMVVRYNSYMEDCIQCLTDSPDALPTDRELAYLARFAKIIEDVNAMYFLEDSTLADEGLSDTKFMYSIQQFSNQIAVLSREAPSTGKVFVPECCS